jgi:hypothetical protein
LEEVEPQEHQEQVLMVVLLLVLDLHQQVEDLDKVKVLLQLMQMEDLVVQGVEQELILVAQQ